VIPRTIPKEALDRSEHQAGQEYTLQEECFQAPGNYRLENGLELVHGSIEKVLFIAIFIPLLRKP
jgi:hypothetical protein